MKRAFVPNQISVMTLVRTVPKNGDPRDRTCNYFLPSFGRENVF